MQQEDAGETEYKPKLVSDMTAKADIQLLVLLAD